MLKANFIFFSILLSLSFYSCKEDDENSSNTSSIQTVGSFANSYLSAQTYRSLNVEILYEEGNRPSNEVGNSIQTFLNQSLNKPQGISLQWKMIPDQGKSTYSLSDLQQIESDFRTVQNSGSSASAYIFFANGDYSENTDSSAVFGIAYKSTSTVVFHKTISDRTGDFGQPSTADIESTVSKHELGHLLGLVNLGSSMVNDHQDVAHGNHCDNTDCLMFWQTESNAMLLNFNNSAVLLGPECQADLRANGGK